MKLFHRITAGILGLSLLVLAGCQPVTGKPTQNIVSSTRYIGQARGFWVTTGAEGDFPSREAVTVEGQQQELAAMVQFAAEHKLNSIFFGARPGATAFYKSKQFPMDSCVATGEKAVFDPLAYLCEQARQNKVQVFAVISPFSMGGSLPAGTKNPFGELPVLGDWLDPSSEQLHSLTAKGAAELAKNYDIAGVVLDGLDASFMQGGEPSAAVEKLTATVGKAVKKANSAAGLAISFDAANEHNAMTVETAGRLAQAGAVTMVLPRMSTSLEHKGATGYLPLLKQWSNVELGSAELYTLNINRADDPYEIHNQLLANAVEGSTAGAVLAPYGWLAGNDSGESELLVSLLSAGGGLPTIPDLSFPQTLAIDYPNDSATVYGDSIYVMGTSDPAQPLTLGGKELLRIGEKGAFGVKVDLAVGSNTITVEQGGKTASVTVMRGSPPTGTQPIKKITTATLFPTTALGLDSNETVEIACVGPAGASITATMGGKTIVLAQTSATKTSGAPVTFKGNISLNPADFDANQVVNIGKVTYVVSFSGNHEVQNSVGEVFVAGKNVPLMLEVPKESYVASVLTDIASDDNFTQSLKAGARVAVTGRTKATRSGAPVIAYKLSSGGYLLGSRATIVADAALCQPDITQITKTQGDDWEQYAFRGGQPGVLATLTEDTLTLRFLNTKMTADPLALAGGMVEQVVRTDTKDGVELALTFPAGSLWGYDITHGEEATTLYLRRTPKRSEVFGKPLDGVQILLDPGHGGSDPGALGIAGVAGPTEAILNMAVADVTKFRLEQLGAQVSLTRTAESERVSLDQRTFQAEQEHPHLFIAIHHNSTVLDKDLAEVRHMEAYYWEHTAKPLADHLMRRLTDTLGRTPSDPENAYYYVTRLTFAPAVLFELGFVVNPAEYEDACDPANLYKAANGIAMAVTELMK